MPLSTQPIRSIAGSLLVAAIMVGCSGPAPSLNAPDVSAMPRSFQSFAPYPTPTPDPALALHDLSGHILFARTVGQDEHIIYLANADGTNECRLTIPPDGVAGCTAVDGRQILLFIPDSPNSAAGTAASMGVDGSGYSVLPIHDPTLLYVPQRWSPDGTRIAFEGFDESDPSRNGIYTARTADGGDIVRLTSHAAHDTPLDYSPDGTQIVFFRAAAEWDDLGGALWLMNVDGSGARELATAGVMPSPGARWSPDGGKILFCTARNQPTGALWTVDPDGSNLTQIFQNTDPRYPDSLFATGPVWSPDGSQIMFTLNPIADWYQHPANDIYIINADGSELAQVVGTYDFKTMYEWWP